MDKKKLERKLKKKWACPKGCDVSKNICEHIETLLPAMQKANHIRDDNNVTRNISYINDLDLLDKWNFRKETMSSLEKEVISDDIEEFIAKLDIYNLTNVEKDVIVARCVQSYSFKLIGEDLGLISGAMGAHRIYRTALEKIKKVLNGK